MLENIKFVIVDDNPDDRLLVRKEIEGNFINPQITEINNLEKFHSKMKDKDFDIVITDYELQWSKGSYILNQVKSVNPDCPVIMYTATGSEEVAVQAMKNGLDDYILKSVKHIKRLPTSITSVIEKKQQTIELREALINLRKSEEKYRTIVTSVVDGIITINQKGIITDINKAALEYFQYDISELLNKNLSKFIPKRYFGLHQMGLKEYLRTGNKKIIGKTIELQAKKKNNSEFPVEITVSEIFIDGEIHFTGIIKDITEKKRLEKEILNLHLAIEQSLNMVIITDVDGNIEYVNPEYTRTTGYSIEELIGENPRILKTGYTSKETYEKLWHSISNGEKWVGTFKNKKKNGKYFRVSATISPVIDISGKIVNYLSIQKDISEEIRKEEQLRQSQKMEALGRLVGGITHDFKNIMTVISMSADYLKITFPDEDEIMTEVKEIQESVEMADSITQQLLTFSKKQKSDFVVFKPDDVLSKLQNWLNRMIGAKINFTLNVKNEDLIIFANPSMLEQVFINIITNARDAMPSGGEINVILEKVLITNQEFECTIEKGYRLTDIYLSRNIENGEYLSLHLKDTGMGMDEETMKKIFEPFFTTKNPGEGTGLGLSTVYGILNDFSGYIGVTSVVNVGTTFHILIPLVK
jgi:two-component system NtrC family sensor kinase